MPWLVDGDNLLGSWPGRRRSDAERRSLAMELGRFAARHRRQIEIVFDGEPPPGLAFGSQVRFSGRGCTADQRILERLRRERDRRGWIVVTSDRSLGDQCRYLGARVERSDRFRGRLQQTVGREKPEAESDIEYWLEQFDDPERQDD